MILASHGLIASSILQVDADWLAYYNRVIAAGGSLTTTEQNATKQLVADLKANSLWTPMKAMYPMVGASAAACAQNLKSASFEGTFFGAWTYDNKGIMPNGTTTYMDTGFNPTTGTTSINFGGYGYYWYGTLSTTGPCLLFAGPSPYWGEYVSGPTTTTPSINDGNSVDKTLTSSTDGFNQYSRISGTHGSYLNNNTAISVAQNTTSLINKNIYIGAGNYSPLPPVAYFKNKLGLVYLSDSQYTSTNQQNIRTSVLSFNSTLGR
jgi:hypothetical protein